MNSHPLTDPTDRQAEILGFITSYWFTHGFPPPMRAVGEFAGIRSPHGVAYHLAALVRKGLLRRVRLFCGGKARTVYAPHPRLHAEGNGRGGVLVATVGGAVSLSAEQWVAWLRAQLEAAGGL